MRPSPTDEANETGLHVVADDGRRGAVLHQEHQVAVVEVVALGHQVLFYSQKDLPGFMNS